jgi:hypothetical protein
MNLRSDESLFTFTRVRLRFSANQNPLGGPSFSSDIMRQAIDGL